MVAPSMAAIGAAPYVESGAHKIVVGNVFVAEVALISKPVGSRGGQ